VTTRAAENAALIFSSLMPMAIYHLSFSLFIVFLVGLVSKVIVHKLNYSYYFKRNRSHLEKEHPLLFEKFGIDAAKQLSCIYRGKKKILITFYFCFLLAIFVFLNCLVFKKVYFYLTANQKQYRVMKHYKQTSRKSSKNYSLIHLWDGQRKWVSSRFKYSVGSMIPVYEKNEEVMIRSMIDNWIPFTFVLSISIWLLSFLIPILKKERRAYQVIQSATNSFSVDSVSSYIIEMRWNNIRRTFFKLTLNGVEELYFIDIRNHELKSKPTVTLNIYSSNGQFATELT
jgi:hypothetical protein